MPARKIAVFVVALVVICVVVTRALFASPVIVVGKTVPATQRVPVEQIDHSSWDTLLRRYVDAKGMVDYATWKSSPGDIRALDDYLARLSAASIGERSDRNSVLAFWINAYNALTIKGILREYPTTSIRNHTPKLVGYNIWKHLQLPVGDGQYSLDAIEHEQLRKMGEPRIHFAIVCASVGCPKLQNTAFQAAELDTQLTSAAKDFFADGTKCRVDSATDTLYLSPILDWFGQDFGDSVPARLKSIAPYLPSGAQNAVRGGTTNLKYLDYDWALNDQRKAKR